MENNKTFGRFLISKRMEHETSARQLAIALDYSAVTLPLYHALPTMNLSLNSKEKRWAEKVSEN